jgi:hypothetical protein
MYLIFFAQSYASFMKPTFPISSGRETLELSKFWEEYLETKRLRWPDQYRARLAPETPLQPELMELPSS